MSVSFCLPHPVAVIAFMICRGLCACTEMLWMCVLYVSFGSKVTGQVGLWVGSWPRNRATEGSNPKGTRLYFVILLKNVEKIFD